MQGTTSKIKTYILAAVFVVLLMAGLFFYFNNLAPIKNQITAVDGQIKQQGKLLDTITAQPAGTAAPLDENTFLLQQEVPVKPLMDQLLLQFEKAEVLSDSLILTMEFTDGEIEAEESDEEEVAAIDPTPAPEGEAAAPAEENSSEAEAAEPAIAPELLPEGVKKITAELTVQSKDYDSLMVFLKEVEKLKRVMVIEGIDFTGPQELEVAAGEDSEEPAEEVSDQLIYELTVSAYYLPELVEYLKDLPRVDFPAPNGKDTPFIKEDDENEED
ncbi:hypothetical protein ACFFJY_03695 [Fictibacillus aquaticus]|uniref:Pilus assembly protein PilO n=1 Tax=Fictibacillus aquaticus TaxID=2021314 RepID=A0A235FG70_9BACL|nr:hypothetical protein [Fictibacillus aquaticus]OYD59725.1 hypothetical protein CGZ90_07545 [Fictibacillus aquaticus]